MGLGEFEWLQLVCPFGNGDSVTAQTELQMTTCYAFSGHSRIVRTSNIENHECLRSSIVAYDDTYLYV